jgi:thiamine-phosphate pyrophosphorylase
VIVCLVTDRRRADPVEQAGAAAAAGIDLIQVRERDMDAKPLAALVGAVLRAVRGTRARVLVNDRLDVALACGAHGVHLRSDSINPADARRIAPSGFLIGRSVHTVAQAGDSTGADFLLAGTVFRTPSKPADTPLLGLEGLAAIVRAVSIPVLAIGGIAPGHFEAIARTGAAGIAAIGLFCSPEGLPPITEEIRFRFDSLKPGS